MTYRLSVDLGTTFVAAAVLRDGVSRVATLGVRQPEIPSVVAITEDAVLVGDAADYHGRTAPDAVARFFKRRFGDSTPLVVKGQPWSAEALSAQLLRHVVAVVTLVEGAEPELVVLTHPAGWSEFRLDALHATARLAGVRNYELIPEPVAAARHYALLDRLPEDAQLAVFDFGGGTFDTTIVKLAADGFHVVGTPAGVDRLGGIDIDEAVFAHACQAVGIDPYELDDAPETRRDLAQLRRECRDAKEMLSETSAARISVRLPGIAEDVDLTRSDFEAMLSPMLVHATNTVDDAIRDAGLSVDDIDAVLLVGGSSRIPAVSQALSARFGRPVLIDTHPKHAIVLGAVQAETLQPAAPSTTTTTPTIATSPHPLAPDSQPPQTAPATAPTEARQSESLANSPQPAGTAIDAAPAHAAPPMSAASAEGTETSRGPFIAVLAVLAAAVVIGGIALVMSRDTGSSTSSTQAASGTTTTPETPSTTEVEPPEATTSEAPDDPESTEPDVPATVPEDRTISVAILDNQPMLDIAGLTDEFFTPESRITVEYTIVDDQTAADLVDDENGKFDVVMVGSYEAAQLGRNGWFVELNDYVAQTPEWDASDVFPAVRDGLSDRGSLYAAPFYAESTLLTYRKDVLENAGLEMPAEPTWDEVAAIARAIDSDDMAGICMRGRQGWGDLGASFTTVLNTFGGTYWAANDDGSIGASQVNQPEFAAALNFYVDLMQDAGPDDPSSVSFNECFTLYKEGKVAMWYDSTVAASFVESTGSPVKGLSGYAKAPTKLTPSSGWLWSWALAIPQDASDRDAAWEYIAWATGPTYALELAPANLPAGWGAVPFPARASLFDEAGYQQAHAPYLDQVLDAMLSIDATNPGTEPRPGTAGVQYVGVPEFQDVGAQCTQQFSAAMAGAMTVDEAIVSCHDTASAVSN